MNTYIVEVRTFYNTPYFTTHVEVDATTEKEARKLALNEPIDYEEGFEPYNQIQSVEEVE
jgi:hypothetical protein